MTESWSEKSEQWSWGWGALMRSYAEGGLDGWRGQPGSLGNRWDRWKLADFRRPSYDEISCTERMR